jgi:hypothetical protein
MAISTIMAGQVLTETDTCSLWKFEVRERCAGNALIQPRVQTNLVRGGY